MGGLFKSFQNTTVLPMEVTRIERKLKPRERLFCSYYACTGDADASARKAGFKKDSRLAGWRLLCDEAILEEIDRQLSLRRTMLPRLAAIGYQRLAFGGISDALRLLFTQTPTPEQLEQMDLFMISEIKRNKDGMLEIKFFDRLKALEKLGSKVENTAGVAGLMDAIGRGAENLGGGNDDQTLL